MERFQSIDFMTLFTKALVKCARADFVGIWQEGSNVTLISTNNASDFNELVINGKLCVRIIFGVMHFGDLDATTIDECKFQARRYNENIALN